MLHTIRACYTTHINAILRHLHACNTIRMFFLPPTPPSARAHCAEPWHSVDVLQRPPHQGGGHQGGSTRTVHTAKKKKKQKRHKPTDRKHPAQNKEGEPTRGPPATPRQTGGTSRRERPPHPHPRTGHTHKTAQVSSSRSRRAQTRNRMYQFRSSVQVACTSHQHISTTGA